MTNPEDGMTAQDLEDLRVLSEDIEFDSDELLDEGPEINLTVLEVWQKVLENVKHEGITKVTMAMALRALNKHPRLRAGDVKEYYDLFHDALGEALGVVEFEIEQDPQALKRVDTDAEDNRGIYLNVMVGWSSLLKLHEDEWDSGEVFADTKLSAYGDAAEFLIGPAGLLAHLQTIDLPFDEDDQAFVNDAVYGVVS